MHQLRFFLCVCARFEQGIGGLQSVVLYALPELDGAIDAIPLGGLCCGDKVCRIIINIIIIIFIIINNNNNNNNNNCKNIDAIALGGLCCGDKAIQGIDF